MAEFRPGYDAAIKWTPPPDWRTAALEGDGWAARPAPPLSRLLVSGDIATAMADLAPAGKDVGLWQICGDAAYALRIGRDRALIVSSTQSDVQTGWNPRGYAVSPADDGWMALDIAGPAMRELVAEMTVADLEAGSPSAACQACGVVVLLHRTAADVARIHVETGHAPYLWRWIERRA